MVMSISNKSVYREKQPMLKKYLESTEFYIVLLVRHSIYWHSKASEIAYSKETQYFIKNFPDLFAVESLISRILSQCLTR